MSNPPDPPGGGKTVLRLNPGGRRAAAPAPPAYTPPAPPAPGYTPPPAAPSGYQQQPQPYNRYAELPADIAANRSKANPDEEWYSAPPPPPPMPEDQRPRSLLLERDVPVAANENIMLEAAGPLLLLLGRLRVQLMHANFANLMDQVADAVEEFDKKMRMESVPPIRSRWRSTLSAQRVTTSFSRYQAPSGMCGCATACSPASSRNVRAACVSLKCSTRRNRIRSRITPCSSSCTPAWRWASRASTGHRRAAPRRCSRSSAIFTKCCARFAPS